MFPDKICKFIFKCNNCEFNYLIQKTNNEISIGYEIGKFICYCSDMNMITYIKEQIKENKFSFNESSFVYNIIEDVEFTEIINDNFIYDDIYILDFDEQILYHEEKYLFHGESFKDICEYPDKLKRLY